MRQHLAAVEAARAVGGARVEGARPGSRDLLFEPGSVRAGEFRVSVGSAGSATLVLQTILPALLTARGPSSIEVEGGTDNPFAPPFEALERSFLPLVRRMGPRVEATILAHGFYPAGGGRIAVTVEPVARLTRLDLLERGQVLGRRARALVAGLPRGIADRELAVVRRELGWREGETEIVELPRERGPGNALHLEIRSEHVTEVFSAFGKRGVPAEAVAESAAREARAYLASGVPVGEHLADQLLLPIALAGGGTFRTLPLSRHATTNAAILRAFLGVEVDVQADGPATCRVEVLAR
jgi:RNA 3'-terminal phosphate cyclase (ATP)